MIKLYCLPGKAIAHLRYLFPDSLMGAIETERQRDSGFIHFLLSTLFYAGIAWFAVMAFSQTDRAPASPAAPLVSTDDDIGEAAVDQSVASEAGGIDEPATPAFEAPAVAPEQVADPIVPASDVEAIDQTMLAKAVKAAVDTGRPQRWAHGDRAGYVVVSEAEPASGCRTYYYSVDKGGHASRSADMSICPES